MNEVEPNVTGLIATGLIAMMFIVVLRFAYANRISRWLDEHCTPAQELGLGCLILVATPLLMVGLCVPAYLPLVGGVWRQIGIYPLAATFWIGFSAGLWLVVRAPNALTSRLRHHQRTKKR